MLKSCILIMLIILTLSLVSQAQAQPNVTIYVRNLAPAISQAELEDDLTAFQWVLNHQLKKYWHVSATLTTTPVQGSWTITILPGKGPCTFGGCTIGFHDVGRYGQPYGVLYLGSVYMFDGSWTESFTHELFEMLVDPMITKKINDGVMDWLVEVSDPVVGYEYTIPTVSHRWVAIADFVTPAWYRHGTDWPYDLMGRLQQPRYLRGGGYASYRGWFMGKRTWLPVSGPGTIDNLISIR